MQSELDQLRRELAEHLRRLFESGSESQKGLAADSGYHPSTLNQASIRPDRLSADMIIALGRARPEVLGWALDRYCQIINPARARLAAEDELRRARAVRMEQAVIALHAVIDTLRAELRGGA